MSGETTRDAIDAKNQKLLDEVSGVSISDDHASKDIQFDDNVRWKSLFVALSMIILLAITIVTTHSNNKFPSNNLRPLATSNQEKQSKTLIAQLCTLEAISSDDGWLKCEESCRHARCCYTKGMNCSARKLKNNTCKDYELCKLLGVENEIKRELKKRKNNEVINKKFTNKNDKIHHICQIKKRNRSCEKLCTPAKCCFTNEECPNNIDKTTFCPKYSNCDYFYSKAESTLQPTCPPDKCCKQCTEDEAINVKVTLKNDSGQEFVKYECAKKINNEVHNHYESLFPLLYIEICLNDWNALESNLDIDFIEQDSNYY